MEPGKGLRKLQSYALMLTWLFWPSVSAPSSVVPLLNAKVQFVMYKVGLELLPVPTAFMPSQPALCHESSPAVLGTAVNLASSATREPLSTVRQAAGYLGPPTVPGRGTHVR